MLCTGSVLLNANCAGVFLLAGRITVRKRYLTNLVGRDRKCRLLMGVCNVIVANGHFTANIEYNLQTKIDESIVVLD